MTAGHSWTMVCALLAVLWTGGACWGAADGRARTALRGALGGLGAVGTASGAYGVFQLAGVEIRWELVAGGLWPALGFAVVIGLVEETAKLIGIVLALSSRRPGDVFRTTAAVAAVFALVEAALVLRGASWPLAVSRAAFAPVAHAALALPFAFALVQEGGRSRWQGALRVGAAVVIAATLHGVGDWSVARPGWGRLGFAAVLLAPVLWVYARARLVGRPGATGHAKTGRWTQPCSSWSPPGATAPTPSSRLPLA